MLFTRVKWNGEKVQLTWTTESGDDVIRHELESFDPPEPALHDALADLIPPALEMLELEPHHADGMGVSGVTIKHEDERGTGCVITLQRIVACSPSPVVINTPYLAEWDENFPLPTKIVTQLDTIQAAAVRYVQGHRAQADLFEEAA